MCFASVPPNLHDRSGGSIPFPHQERLQVDPDPLSKEPDTKAAREYAQWNLRTLTRRTVVIKVGGVLSNARYVIRGG